jgi:hypothetical protein
MLDHDAADDPLASCFDDPIAHMEPVEEYDETQEQREKRIEREAYREAAIRETGFRHSMLAFILEATNDHERLIRIWAVCSTLNHAACDGRSDSAIAGGLGTTRANFCKHRLSFQRQNSIGPAPSQKSIEARNEYSEVRKSQLA